MNAIDGLLPRVVTHLVAHMNRKPLRKERFREVILGNNKAASIKGTQSGNCHNVTRALFNIGSEDKAGCNGHVKPIIASLNLNNQKGNYSP